MTYDPTLQPGDIGPYVAVAAPVDARGKVHIQEDNTTLCGLNLDPKGYDLLEDSIHEFRRDPDACKNCLIVYNSNEKKLDKEYGTRTNVNG